MKLAEFIEKKHPGKLAFELSDEEYRNCILERNKQIYKPKQRISKCNKKVGLLRQEKIDAARLEKAKALVFKRSESQRLAFINRSKNSSEPKAYRTYKLRANAKSLKFNLSVCEFNSLVERDCVYCGGQGGGIDRINTKEGYTIQNSAPCCWKCNAMKYTHTVDDFIKHVKKIFNHISESNF